MKNQLRSAVASALILGLVALAFGMHRAPVATADGPIGGVSPLGGTMYQTFTLGFKGFEPNAVLTLSFLPPGGTTYLIVDNPMPLVSDSQGQAGVLIDLPNLLGYPASTQGVSDDPITAKLAGIYRIVWGPGPSTPGARFHVDACDVVSCVDLVGAFVPLSGQ